MSSSKNTKSLQKFAKKLALSMAYSRKEYQDKIEHVINGAYLEFYKARLASKNGYIKWVQHWMTEVDSLLNFELRRVLIHSTRGFSDRRKVYQAVRAERLTKDISFRGIAERVIKKDFQVSKLPTSLDDKDRDDFWKMVDESVDLTI